MNDMIATGDKVNITCQGRTHKGEIALASANGKSLMVIVEDGMVAGWVGAVPLLLTENGFETLNGEPCEITKEAA